MSVFLRLKHWQLFVLLLGIPVVMEIFMVSTMITTRDFTIVMKAFPVMMAVMMAVFFGWFYALGTGLHKKLPETVPMNLGLFKAFLLIPVVYIIGFSFYMTHLMGFMMTADLIPAHNTPPGPIPVRDLSPELGAFFLIVPLHLCSMFCIFYCIYFIAKALKAVELQRPVVLGDYIGEFFLIWFYIVGVWIIQPKVNKLFGPQPDEWSGSSQVFP